MENLSDNEETCFCQPCKIMAFTLFKVLYKGKQLVRSCYEKHEPILYLVFKCILNRKNYDIYRTDDSICKQVKNAIASMPASKLEENKVDFKNTR